MEQNGMKVEDFFNAIKKRWKMIIGIIVVVGIFAVILGSKKTEVKSEYEVNSKIYVYNNEERNNNEINAQKEVIDYTLINSFAESLKSRTFMQKILDEANSDIDVNIFYDDLWVTPVKDSQVIKLSFTGNDKEELIRILEIFQKRAIEMAPVAIENSEAKIIEEISVISDKDITKKSPTIIIIVLGAFASVLLAFLQEYLDNSIKNEEQVEYGLNINLLGKIVGNDDEVEYSKIRTGIKHLSNNKNNKIIVVLDSKDNKEIAYKISQSFAKIQAKTLFINNEIKNSNFNKGIIEVLENSESINNVLVGKNEYLDEISLGNIKDTNVNLLDSKIMDNVLSDLKVKYEYIIINAKQLGASIESEILLAKADEVILTAQANVTKVDAVEKLIRRIKKLNINLTGMILKK